MQPTDTGTGSGESQNLYPHLTLLYVTIILIPAAGGLFSFGPQCSSRKAHQDIKKKIEKEGPKQGLGEGRPELGSVFSDP